MMGMGGKVVSRTGTVSARTLLRCSTATIARCSHAWGASTALQYDLLRPDPEPWIGDRKASMESLTTAVIRPTSPSDVLLVPHDAGTTAAVPAATDPPRPALALARVNQPALTAWLREAINLVLAGHAVTQHRPAGILIERGSFAQEDVWVWAYDWYGRGRRVAVAQCADSDAARDLAGRLNHLLDRPST